jgi:predicted house-cleaning noncanonical NTP pyrophosphatase (MazG superfamily)
MAQIEINVSGRIPKYFFGVLNEKYREEVKEALQYCNDEEVETENEFLEKIFALTLDGWGDPKEELYNAISKENLEKLPNFNELVNDFIENGGSHYEMIDCLFDSISMYKYGSNYGISFFENDAYITVTNVDTDEVLVEETKLEDFISGGEETMWAEEVEEGGEGYEDFKRINEFKSANTDFGFDDENYYSWHKNELGSTFLSCELGYPELEEFTNAHPREEQVTVYFDDITNWYFTIDTEDEEFDFKNLTFVSYPGAEEFRNSACENVFNHLFYKNELINPEENWIRDKGITLMYGEARGMDRLDFFLYR